CSFQFYTCSSLGLCVNGLRTRFPFVILILLVEQISILRSRGCRSLVIEPRKRSCVLHAFICFNILLNRCKPKELHSIQTIYHFRSEYFIQATQVDTAQVQAISSIIHAFGWRQVVPVYVDNEFGGGLIPTLTDALQEIGTRIPYRSLISSTIHDDQIVTELYKLKSMETRVFIVHMEASLGIRLFSKAKKLGMMTQDYAWIITNGVGNDLNTLSPEQIQLMEGVIGVKTYIPPTKELADFIIRWKKKLSQQSIDEPDPQITIFYLCAYDATTMLARAVEQVGGTGLKFERIKTTSNISSTDLSRLGVSQAGKNLIKAIKGTRFTGLSGEFILIDGQLQSSIIEIINVINKEQKMVGFWAPQNGFLKEMNSTTNSQYSITKDKLGSIIWPGGSKDPPKGWVLPINNEKRLRILVPIKDGFDQFVKVEYVSGLEKPKITGYCIDIFDAVMSSLPYPVPYEYFPFTKPNNAATESYDEFISEVYFQKFDAAVGDVTIIANRSLYVDFTLPYTESGVVMITSVKDDKKMNWVFVRPLSWDLWITSLCYFMLFALVIWVLEHPINQQFRGPAQYQFGTSLYYSFSTMVFAHGQHVFSNLGRCVVIIWLFFVLILTQSYTASLASMLTVQQLQPMENNIHELIKTGKVVGHQEGSFVKDLLRQKGFKESKLKSFKSVEELDDLLTKGMKKGGIAAAFDEIPYVKVFLANPTYCSKYMIVPPTYKADGLGFVFPLGSPLVAEVSRQVLNLTEGDQMINIERKWFGDETSCTDLSRTSLLSSRSLGLKSFRELFIITGSIAVCALVVFFTRFLKKHKRVWRDRDPNISLWDKAKELARIFDQGNTESHTFKMSERHHMSPQALPSSPIIVMQH
ncbi:hypothetical protein V2J09_011230, partial [Rumex salicifolius]